MEPNYQRRLRVTEGRKNGLENLDNLGIEMTAGVRDNLALCLNGHDSIVLSRSLFMGRSPRLFLDSQNTATRRCRA